MVHSHCLAKLPIIHNHKMSTKNEMTKTASPVHFVLVHGASLGAWSWYKVRCLLECAGHKVSCPDLRSSGIDPADANTIFTFKEYNKPLDDILSGLDECEKVILVGHSAGGLSLTNAIHNWPDKILVAVFVAAAMSKDGTESHQAVKRSSPDIWDYEYGLGPDQPPTSVIMKEEFRREFLFQRSPLEDCTLAAMLLKRCPGRALADAKLPDVVGMDEVPRVYIKTLHDNLFAQDQQDSMIKKWPPQDVYTVDSDHCAMFSNPFQLSGLLLKIAAQMNPKKVPGPDGMQLFGDTMHGILYKGQETLWNSLNVDLEMSRTHGLHCKRSHLKVWKQVACNHNSTTDDANLMRVLSKSISTRLYLINKRFTGLLLLLVILMATLLMLFRNGEKDI